MDSELLYSRPFLLACHECDLIHRLDPLPSGGVARCSRCGAVLHRRKENSVVRTSALAVTGIILFIIANLYPFLGFRIGTKVHHSNLITGVVELYHSDMWFLATLVLVTTILVPAFQLVGMLYVLFPFFMKVHLPKRKHVFRILRLCQPWGMTEVFLLGILVALVKLSKMATIIPGTAVYAFMALMFVLAAMSVLTDPHLIWAHEGNRP